jgi:hypothetical protein
MHREFLALALAGVAAAVSSGPYPASFFSRYEYPLSPANPEFCSNWNLAWSVFRGSLRPMADAPACSQQYTAVPNGTHFLATACVLNGTIFDWDRNMQVVRAFCEFGGAGNLSTTFVSDAIAKQLGAFHPCTGICPQGQ